MLNTLVIKGKRPTVVREKGRENIPKHRHSGSSGWVTVWDKGDRLLLAQGEINRCEKARWSKSSGPLSSEIQSVKRAVRKEREEKQLRVQRPKDTRVLHVWDSPARVEGSRNNRGCTPGEKKPEGSAG